MQPHDQLESDALPRSRRPDDHGVLPVRHLERNAVEHGTGAEGLGDLLEVIIEWTGGLE